MPSLRPRLQWQIRRAGLAWRGSPWIRGGAMAALLVIGAGAVSGGWFAWTVVAALPGPQEIHRASQMDEATTLYDAADRPVFTIFKEQRIEVPLERISPNLVRAVIAIEDQRFYDHHGIDVVRIVAAALANLQEGRRAQGGSTITQQLARQSFLTADKTIRRKLSEAVLAWRLEDLYSKREILRLYLNKVYFGDGFYGAEAAALGYFGVHAADLTLAQAALVAGLVKSPSTYAPTINRDRATARRNTVLQAMLDTGAITPAQCREAAAEPVALHGAFADADAHGLYFKEQVRRELVDRFGWERVYEGGLRVYTTLDLDMQIAADAAVRQALADIDARRAGAGRTRAAATSGAPGAELEAALVALDPATGAVRAMVGGRDFHDSTFNRAVQARRQPGSAFKPIVYAEALESGFTPATLIDHLDEPVDTPQGAWTPEDEHLDTPAITLRAALRTSSNRAAVRLLQEVGVDRAVAYAKQVGLGALPTVPSLALGSGEVTLLSLAAAYLPFANEGLARPPVLIRRVEDRQGHVLFRADGPAVRVISRGTAFLMSQMLADVVNAGTAARVRQRGFRLPAAGKTGTTNDYHDVWFVGYTPKLLAGVWIGFDQPQTILRRGYAGDLAVPLWADFMKAATAGDAPVWFQPPPDIVAVRVCRVSGKLPAAGCERVPVVTASGQLETQSMVYTEYFVRGTEPHDVCDVHGSRSLLQRLAGLFSTQPAVPASRASLVPVPAPPVQPQVADAGPAGQPARPPDAEPARKKRGFWARLFGIGEPEKKAPNAAERTESKGKTGKDEKDKKPGKGPGAR